MSFFDSLPALAATPPRRARRPAWARSDAVIPGAVAGEVIVARTEQAAVAAGSIRAYPNGFEFMVHIRLRYEDDTSGEWAMDPFIRHGRGSREPRDALRLGLMYADGRRAASSGGPDPSGGDPGHLILHPEGGGGDSLSWRTDFWAHPLPPDGPVTLVVSWPAQRIEEARAELDGAAIRAAAQRAVTLWPEEPATESAAGWTTSTITVTEGAEDD
jgi:hypothetical protein